MLTLAVCLAGEAQASRIVVNEFYRSGSFGSTGDEWIELVLLEDLTAAELSSFFIGDSTSATASKFSGYSLQNTTDFAAVFPAGTILVLTGGAAGPAPDLTYDPANGDWNLVLPTTDAHVLSNGSTGDLASTDVVYVDTNGTNGDATLSADGFAANWDTSPGTFGALAVLVPVPGNPGFMVLGGDPLTSATDPASWAGAASGTAGQPNGGANDTGVLALRTVACPDADADGVCDADDTCPGFDDLADSDFDGVADGCDTCPGADDLLDTDGDGTADGCDACPADAEPSDDDADGVCDSDDVCAGGDDTLDADGDGVPNACDLALVQGGTVRAGQPINLRVLRAQPGETVYFYWSPGPAGAGPCPAQYGGGCLSLGAPIYGYGSAVADATGTATRNVIVSNTLVAGMPVTFQAAIVRGAGGVDSDFSPTVTRVVQP